MDGNYQNCADTLSDAKHYVKKAFKTNQDSLTTGN